MPTNAHQTNANSQQKIQIYTKQIIQYINMQHFSRWIRISHSRMRIFNFFIFQFVLCFFLVFHHPCNVCPGFGSHLLCLHVVMCVSICVQLFCLSSSFSFPDRWSPCGSSRVFRVKKGKRLFPLVKKWSQNSVRFLGIARFLGKSEILGNPRESSGILGLGAEYRSRDLRGNV